MVSYPIALTGWIGFYLCRCFVSPPRIDVIDSREFLFHKVSQKLALGQPLRKGKDLLMRLPWSLLNKKLKLADQLSRDHPSLFRMKKYQRESFYHPLIYQNNIIYRYPKLAALPHTTLILPCIQMKIRKAVQWMINQSTLVRRCTESSKNKEKFMKEKKIFWTYESDRYISPCYSALSCAGCFKKKKSQKF